MTGAERGITAGERPVPSGSAWAAAAFGYCAALLVAWLLCGEFFRLLLSDRPRLLLVGAQICGIFLPALALTRLFSQAGFRISTSKRPPPAAAATTLALAGLALGGYLVALALQFVWLEGLHSTGWAWVAEWEALLTEGYRKLLIAGSGAELLGVLLMVSLVPAVCEELAFRRGLQGLLASRMSGAKAVTLSAAVFSLFHLDPFGLPTRFFLGLSLGIVYHRTGKLWTAGVLHAAHNLATVAGLHYAESLRDGAPPSLNELADMPAGPVAVVGALGLAAWVVSLQLLRPPGENSLDEPDA
jgi:membrane protease YdiL (CAAX protease family)